MPLIDVEPFYFLKLNASQLLFLSISIKAGTQLQKKKTVFSNKCLDCIALIYNKEEVGYLFEVRADFQNSGSYIASISKSAVAKEASQVVKLAHLVIYDLDNAFLAISSKMSSMTQFILEEQ
jgi:hypothetical protein